MERTSVHLQVPSVWHRLQTVLLIFQLLLSCPGQRWVCAEVGEVSVGMNYGRVSHQILKASIAVDLMERLGIKKVKLFNADEKVLNAMAKTSSFREVMVTVTNQEMKEVAASQDAADKWVKHNVVRFVKLVPITCVAVGNEPFLQDYYEEFKDVVHPALSNIATALERENLLETVKVTVAMNADVVNNTDIPVNGQFKDSVRMTQICEVLHRTKSFFTVNIYPFYMYKDNPVIDLRLVMFEQGDPGGYGSLLDRAYDGVIAALQKINYPDMKVVLGEVGWPTDGHEYATKDMARRFNNGCLKHLARAGGTVLRPNQQIDAYMFSLFDENAKSILPGPFERHWGIFDYAGRPKYLLDFTGQGLETQLPLARSQIVFLPNRWCIAPKPYELPDPNKTRDEVEPDFCPKDERNLTVKSDCSSTVQNASCYFGGDTRKILNVWMNYKYQLAKQDEKVCEVKAIKGQIVTYSPSEANCTFMQALADSMLDLNAATRWGCCGSLASFAMTTIWSALTACAVILLL